MARKGFAVLDDFESQSASETKKVKLEVANFTFEIVIKKLDTTDFLAATGFLDVDMLSEDAKAAYNLRLQEMQDGFAQAVKSGEVKDIFKPENRPLLDIAILRGIVAVVEDDDDGNDIETPVTFDADSIADNRETRTYSLARFRSKLGGSLYLWAAKEVLLFAGLGEESQVKTKSNRAKLGRGFGSAGAKI